MRFRHRAGGKVLETDSKGTMGDVQDDSALLYGEMNPKEVHDLDQATGQVFGYINALIRNKNRKWDAYKSTGLDYEE